jgi:hypothetical protein
MKILVSIIATVVLFGVTQAHSQIWAGVPATGNGFGGILTSSQNPSIYQVGSQFSVGGVSAPLQITGQESIALVCGSPPFNSCPESGQVTSPGVGTIAYNVAGGLTVPLNDFALSSTVAQIQSSFAEQISQLQSQYSALSIRTADFTTMAAALHGMMPLNGMTNRMGLNVSMVDGRQGVALNYVHVSDVFDFDAGAAMAGRDAMGQVGIGVSW